MKAVLERKKAAATVIAASRRWAASAAEALGELLRPLLREGETLPDLVILFELLARLLEGHWRRLEAADQGCCRARELRGLWLEKLTVATSELRRMMVDLRALLRGIFGTGPARRPLGFTGKTSYDPVSLGRQAGYAIDRLRDGAQTLSPAACQASTGDRESWARPVERAAGVLERTRVSASLAGKQAEAAAAELKRARARFDDVFVPIAGWLEATYRVAGRDQRAAAVRPSRRRPGVLLADEDRRHAQPAKAASDRLEQTREQPSAAEATAPVRRTA